MKKETFKAVSFKDHWKDDLRAGFNVSLIALPLSLGIALASGFPPAAGLFAAIIGGLLVSRINGSFVTIVGPAAGLIVVNLSAIETLGLGDNAAGYRYALAAIVVAGLVIVGLGLLKAGKFGDFFPSSAVHGMLAAIGIIIMVKQFFVAVAVRAHGHEFYEILEEIPVAFRHANPEVIGVALVSLAILIFHPKVNNKMIRAIPAPVWVLLVAVPLEFLMDFEHEHQLRFLGEVHKVGPQLLVHLPDNIADAFVLPDFGKFATSVFWVSVMTIALVTALESVLSAIAVDSLDPAQRKTNLNRDLKGLGVGTAASGLIGGLPMISEIVRSSANVSSGAKTQWANFFHGGFLLIFLLAGAPVINHIPLSALAAMLLFTGYRLASPREFKYVYQIGKTELLVFVSTIVMVLMTDLLIGVAIGLMVNLLVNIVRGTTLRNLFAIQVREEVKSGELHFHLSGAVVFSNYLGLKKRVLKHAEQSVKLDMAEVTFIDHSSIHHLHKLEQDFAAREVGFELINDRHLLSETSHPMSARMVKSTGPGTQALSAHQQMLEGFARAFNGLFQQDKLTRGISELKKYHFGKNGRIHFIQNQVAGHFDKTSFQYMEVDFDADITTKSSTDIIPVIMLTPGGILPEFTLEKEEFYDKLAGLAGWEDIDFEGYPVFSDTFLLKGKEEDKIRRFFTDRLIGYLEQTPEFHMESDGSRLILYRFDKDISARGVQSLFGFAMELSRVLEAQRLQVQMV